MKLFFVTFHYGSIQNGPGRFAAYFIEYVMRQQPDIDLTVISGDGSVSLYGEKLVYMPRKKHKFATIITSMRIQAFLKRQAAAGKVDCVYYNSLPQAAFPVPGVRSYVNSNDYYNLAVTIADFKPASCLKALYKTLYKYLEKRGYSNSDRIFANSEYTARMLKRHAHSGGAGKIRVTYKAVNADAFRTERRPPTFDHGVRLAFVGTDYERKGVFDAIHVCLKLNRAHRLTASLSVIGKFNPSQKREIVQSADALGIGRSVNVFHSDSVAEEYAKSHFFILPAYQEALGVAIIEAMASGLPVVTSVHGGIPEIITHGKNGFLFDPSAHDDMARTVASLCEQPELYARISRAAIDRAHYFSIPRIIGRNILGNIMEMH